MQGVFIHGDRPATKKELRETVDFIDEVELWEVEKPNGEVVEVQTPHQHDGYCVVVEATSVFGNEYDGSLASAPKVLSFNVVGPDPHTKRNWYANITFDTKKGRWIVT